MTTDRSLKLYVPYCYKVNIYPIQEFVKFHLEEHQKSLYYKI